MWEGALVRKTWLISTGRLAFFIDVSLDLDRRGWEWCPAVVTPGTNRGLRTLSASPPPPTAAGIVICSSQLPREGRQFHLYREKQRLWNQKFAQGHFLGLTLDSCELPVLERVGQVGTLPVSFQVGRKSGQAEAPATDHCGKSSCAKKHPSR